MNCRSQGGSALTPGGIEFMQHRRIPADDSRGMGEWVDEKDTDGNGIKVPASYFVQIFDESKRKTEQRTVLQKTLDPAQYFFNFGLKPTKQSLASKHHGNQVSKVPVETLMANIRLFATPVAKHEILVRVENL